MVLNEELVEGVRLELEIERIVHGGLGLGHVDGFVVMTPFAAPGDLLSVVVVKRRRRYALAEPLAVLRASPWRQEPQCPWFTQCGGCNLGHLAIERQRQVKAELLASELGLPPIELKAGAALRYRNKGSFHVGEDGRLGFYRRGSNELVALDTGSGEETHLGAIDPNADAIARGAMVAMTPLVVDLAKGAVIGRFQGVPCAITSTGRVLLAPPPARPDRLPDGPLRWQEPGESRPRDEKGARQ